MGYILEIELDYLATDPNNILGRHWRSKHGRFQKIKNDIAKLAHGKTPPEPLTKFKISVTRKARGYLDWDNLIASLKPAIDGLTLAGIIKDDNWKYIRHIDVDQIPAKGEEKKLLIRVEEVAEQSPAAKRKRIMEEIL